MQLKSYLPATVAVWVLYLVFDNFVAPNLFGSLFAAIPGAVAESSQMWETVGDLAAAAVLVWFYDKVKGVFGSGVSGGVKYGFSAGVLVNFPTWLFATVYFSWPYRGTWMFTIALVLLTTVAGALIGLVYEKTSAPA
jgi:hypothetical protein